MRAFLIMLVTINTDASFNKDILRASYAFWIKTDNYTIKMSGIIRTKCKDSTEAELKCIVNALYVVSKQIGIKSIIVNTDSLNSIHVLTKDIENIRKYRLHWADKYMKIANSYINGKKVKYRHVKAHSGTDSSRTYVNDWCDKMAKERLKSLIY